MQKRRLLSVDEAAAMLLITPSHLKRLIKKGDLVAYEVYKDGKAFPLIPVEEVYARIGTSEPVVTLRYVANKFAVRERTVRKWAKRGLLKPVENAKGAIKLWFIKAEVDNFKPPSLGRPVETSPDDNFLVSKDARRILSEHVGRPVEYFEFRNLMLRGDIAAEQLESGTWIVDKAYLFNHLSTIAAILKKKTP